MPNRQGDDEPLTRALPEKAKAQVQQTMEKLEAVANGVITVPPRPQCYRRIINYLKHSLALYYARFPERALDARGRDNEEKMVNDADAIIRILDDYDIAYKKTENT